MPGMEHSSRTFGLILRYLLIVLVFSSLVFLGAQRPWKGMKSRFSKVQIVQIMIYGFVVVLQLIVWHAGLSLFGPLRTLLLDYADLSIVYICRLLLTSTSAKRPFQSSKMNGGLLLCIGYFLLFFTAGTSDPSSDRIAFGPVSVTESTLGGLIVLLSVLINIVRQFIGRKFTNDTMGAKRLYSLGISAGTLIFAPVLLFASILHQPTPNVSAGEIVPPFPSPAATIALAFVFTIVVNYYIETVSLFQCADTLVFLSSSLFTTFLAGAMYQSYSEQSFPGILFLIAFALILGGMHLLYSTDESWADPTRRAASLAAPDLWDDPQARLHKKPLLHPPQSPILEKSDSRRIFLYLLANLMFMFVELLYGIWTNSLGLISDAAHMMFDCTALAIGLYAAVIAKWDPTKVFSYGYGRVQVLAGFVNAIFLMFIACSVFLESIHRFLEPQEIKSERLLLVSVLGLLVNLVGLFAFHHHDDDDDESGHHHHHHHHHHHEHKHKKRKEHDHHVCEHDHEHEHQHEHKDKKKKKDHHHHHDDNLYGVYLHVLADTLGSVSVIISSIFVHYWGIMIADPICSFLLSLMIFGSVIPLLKKSAATLLQTTPVRLEEKLEETLRKVKKLDGVINYSDAHFWSHNSKILVGTLHVQARQDVDEQKLQTQIAELFKKRRITYLTVQINKERVNPATGLIASPIVQ